MDIKKITKALCVLLLLLCSTNTFAQGKFGHIDISALVEVMPERVEAQKSMQKLSAELEQEMKNLQTEYQTKLSEYEKNAGTWSDPIKSTKEDDLQAKMQQIQTFSQNAQRSLQQEQVKLLDPIIKKAQNAVDEVAKELNMDLVFDTSNQVLMYHSSESLDLLPKVKDKLGL
ncbi:MAG: OmpH family outer membrane protein [Bacteroidales bacterium]